MKDHIQFRQLQWVLCELAVNMDTSHWHWTIFGWEKLYSTNLTQLKDENGTRGIPHSTDHHWLFGPRKVVKRNKYPIADRVHGNLGALNSRRESKSGGPMNLVREGRTLSWRNTDKGNRDSDCLDNGHKNESVDDLTEMCLSTSVIPSILLHDRLTEDLKKRSSMSGCTFDSESADPKVDMLMPWNGKDVRSNCNLYAEDNHHWDTDASDAQVNYQMESHFPCDFDGMSSTEYVDARDPSYFMTDACPTDEMRFLDNSDLCDENLVDDLLREIDDVDDIDNIDQTEEITVDRRSFQNDAHGESEAERMKRQLSLMGKNERNALTICVWSSVKND